MDNSTNPPPAMSSIHSEIQCRLAPNLPATTDDRLGPTHLAHQSNEMDIPQNSTSTLKRSLPQESESPNSKRSNISETEESSETTANETPSASSCTVKNNSASSNNQQREQTPAPLQHNLEANNALMAAPLLPPPQILENLSPCHIESLNVTSLLLIYIILPKKIKTS